ncbi:hypothetical protein MUA48_07865 [Staphylococcus sp. IVB6238]|uniref:hypothetical protein n=1 Tax=Staphylococcus sp. IVB6238 TaxID=2989770 RepID=UPI0021D29B38|nr:hypothetical protein [Staphylococcus sp. IVB6238]UXR73289.1 hypothetical protein MUA48_07865 [Staphylococcus sp. IVB6238]
MIEVFQKRKTLNNDDEYQVFKILTENGIEFIVVNLRTGVGKIAAETEIEEQLPVIIEN